MSGAAVLETMPVQVATVKNLLLLNGLVMTVLFSAATFVSQLLRPPHRNADAGQYFADSRIHARISIVRKCWAV
jgi:hypothetical protein